MPCHASGQRQRRKVHVKCAWLTVQAKRRKQREAPRQNATAAPALPPRPRSRSCGRSPLPFPFPFTHKHHLPRITALPPISASACLLLPCPCSGWDEPPLLPPRRVPHNCACCSSPRPTAQQPTLPRSRRSARGARTRALACADRPPARGVGAWST